jgi:chemotaxis protein MotB
MRTRRSLLSTDEGTGDLWPSFTDIMSTIALILFVLVLLAYVQNLISAKRLKAYQSQITSSETKLRRLESDLARTNAEIEAGRKRLKLSEDKLEHQQEFLAESNRELGDLRSQLQRIAVLPVDILNKVKTSLESELSATTSTGAPLVSIGNNGNIVINESVVFEVNSYAVKKEALPLINGLARALGNVLADPNVRQSIDAVVIQGHTDERGTEALNRDLSAKRANAVLEKLFEANKALEDSYGSFFAASGYSKFRPLNPAKTEAAYQQNRRIEIAVMLKDSNVRKVIDDYMQNQPLPPPGAPPGAPTVPRPAVPPAP